MVLYKWIIGAVIGKWHLTFNCAFKCSSAAPIVNTELKGDISTETASSPTVVLFKFVTVPGILDESHLTSDIESTYWWYQRCL